MFNSRLQYFGGQADRWLQTSEILRAFFASEGRAGRADNGQGVAPGIHDEILQNRMLLLASAAIAMAVVALAFEALFWLYASEQDVAGRIDLPELFMILVLAGAIAALLALQHQHRRLLELSDAAQFDQASGSITDAREELAANRSEIARQRQRIAELEARRILPPNVIDERLALVGHDLRTPLNAVIGFSDLMAQEVYGPIGHPKYREYARHIRESGRSLLGVAQDILAMQAEHDGQSASTAHGRKPGADSSNPQTAHRPSAVPASDRAVSRTLAAAPTQKIAGPMTEPRVDVELAITRSLAGLRKTAENLGAADRRPARQAPAFGRRSVA